MSLFLTLLSGICWTIVYLKSIHIGVKDKTYSMPLFALALNIGWEGLYSYTGLRSNSANVQSWINLIWFLFDILIVYTYFKYGKAEFSKYAPGKFFIPWSFLIFFMAFVLQYSFLREFDNLGPIYSAFIQNLIMSVLYINMLVSRGNTKGQSLVIAFAKWIGTLAPTILIGMQGYRLAMILGIFCSVFDIIYIFYLNYYRKINV
jgi:hypothetical protein